MTSTYQAAGVSLEAAEATTKKIAALAKSTFNSQVLKEIGLFAGFFALDLQHYSDPVIVSSIDGVGTKLKIAFASGRHDSIGQDLVNHCVNDIMTCGADPLFFLDYLGLGRLDPDTATALVGGMAQACRENGCALIGGETAEMPGFYANGEYDLAGTIIGAVNRSEIIDGSRISPGDLLLGLPSTGLHTNGYALARKVLFEVQQVRLDDQAPSLGMSWSDVLLQVHRSYQKPILAVRRHPALHGISHVTGGGIAGNTHRLLRPGLQLEIDWHCWTVPPLFQMIQEYGRIADDEMRRVFNLGIGLVLVVQPEGASEIIQLLTEAGEAAFAFGRVVPEES
ncbi:MAG TPA: phosphoribosylformylglycinamidine cyclo-ligase [bacterium]|nr:phosphoribosylformylglycinamidine cyclo-ligase [bacterium]HQI49534.1 phosphoribosylformylglycinamidine cyclo-ligase [bacterium]HQJ64712.1 phosphoribosylformylglycinamidine cyclo-ligase [bacterium]